MGSTSAMLALFAVAYVVFSLSSVEAAGGACPLPSKVYSCSPKCTENYECSHGKVCCPNSCNAKSCTESAAYGGAGGDKYSQSGGAGVYCANVKCSSFEKCITDPATKRQKCGRA